MEKLTGRGTYGIAHNDKYMVFVGGGTRIFDKHDLKTPLLHIATRYAFWCGFLSEEEILVKSTTGKYWLIDMRRRESVMIKPKVADLGADTDPMLDPENRVLYDFAKMKKDRFSALIRISLDGTVEPLFELPTYGVPKFLYLDREKAVFVNHRGINEGEYKNFVEVRRLIYDIPNGRLAEEKMFRREPRCRDKYYTEDFALFGDGTMCDYDGKLLARTYMPIAREPYAFHVEPIAGTKIWFGGSERMHFGDLADESFLKTIELKTPVTVTPFEDTLLVGTWNGVYRFAFDEIYPADGSSENP